MPGITDAKSSRLLTIYVRLMAGQTLKKSALAEEFNVTHRSIQRDMEDLRCFLADERIEYEIIYDRQERGYRLREAAMTRLTNSEALAVCKILLESRSMRRDEMMPILDKIVNCCVPEGSHREVTALLANEKFHYIEPHHGRSVLKGMWEIGQAVQRHLVMEIEYQKLKRSETVRRVVEPVGILFSEYYFYLVAYIRDIDRSQAFKNPEDDYPTIYRIDRIQSFRITDEHFHPAYASRFQEGEFRKRVQFMYGGKLERIRFKYTGASIESVLDRLPTAEIIAQDDEGWTVEAEVFGKGIEMWMRGQGEHIGSVK